MDQLSAHLDRGWDLAQRGDIAGAHSSAQRAVELSPESPEAHNLLGYVSALQGDCEEAIEAYQQAIALDDTYVEAMLNAAELLVHPLGEFDEALSMCDQALGVTDYEDEIVDALLLKYEAMMAKGDQDGARQVLRGLPSGPFENAAHACMVGRAHYELGALDEADKLLQAAIQADPHSADAHYYHGLVCEERGDRRGACAALLHARQLDVELGMPPWAPSAEAFLGHCDKAIKSLPADLRPHVEGAELFIADMPGPEVIVDGVDPRTLVLVELLTPFDAGEDDGEGGGGVRIFLYALNVLRSAGSVHLLEQHIAEALEHEIRYTFVEPDLGELGELADQAPPSRRRRN